MQNSTQIFDCGNARIYVVPQELQLLCKDLSNGKVMSVMDEYPVMKQQ